MTDQTPANNKNKPSWPYQQQTQLITVTHTKNKSSQQSTLMETC